MALAKEPNRHGRGRQRSPAHWPSDLTYTRTMVYSASIPPSTLKFIRGSGSCASAPDARTTVPPVIIRHIDRVGHPACGQMGLFATKNIPSNAFILYYIGEVHVENRPDSDYDLSLHREYMQDDQGRTATINVGVGCLPNYLHHYYITYAVKFKIDASKVGNEARFINDFRGIKQKPNALLKEMRDRSGGLSIAIWSGSEPISKGDEILISYGKSWWKARHEQASPSGTNVAADPSRMLDAR